MQIKLYHSLLALLTVGAFTSNASASICNYNAGVACSMSSSIVGSTSGCTAYNDIYYNGNCLKNCSSCSSGYTKTNMVYTDTSGCTINYYACKQNTTGSQCSTTNTIPTVGSDYTIINSIDNCDTKFISLRCTSAGECVQDCETCDDGYELTEKKVSASTGCYMTYDGCAIASDDECTTNADCYSGSTPEWKSVSGRIGVQSREQYACLSGICVSSTAYRCGPGYAGLLITATSGTCKVCGSGFYSEGGAATCTVCPDGSFTNATTGAIRCTSCVTATGNEVSTSVAPAITSESCFLPAGTQMPSDETGTKKLIENCYYEAGPLTEIGGGTIVL